MWRMPRSLVTIDVGAIRRNAAPARGLAGPAELWAVVKADGYGHGAADAARAALDGGRDRALRRDRRRGARRCGAAFPDARIVVLGPTADERDRAGTRGEARARRRPTGASPRACTSTSSSTPGWAAGASRELPEPGARRRRADDPPRDGRHRSRVRPAAARALPRRDRAVRRPRTCATSPTAPRRSRCRSRGSTPRAAGSRCTASTRSARTRRARGLEPALRWESELAQVRRLAPGASTGYGRRFVAAEETWIGIVPVGYADGFRRDLTGTEVLVGGGRAEVVGTVSMDALAVRLPGAAPRRDAGHARRRRHHPRGARARRGDDRLRARVRDPRRSEERSTREVVG